VQATVDKHSEFEILESYELFKKLRASPEVAKELGTLGREEIETGEIGDRVELSRSAMG